MTSGREDLPPPWRGRSEEEGMELLPVPTFPHQGARRREGKRGFAAMIAPPSQPSPARGEGVRPKLAPRITFYPSIRREVEAEKGAMMMRPDNAATGRQTPGGEPFSPQSLLLWQKEV